MYGYQSPAAATRDGSSSVLLFGTSAPMQEVEHALCMLAPAEINIVVQGEAGTGKRAFAEALHRRSARAACPFYVLSLAGLPPAQAERELLGADGVEALARQTPGATLYLEGVERLAPALQRGLAHAAYIQDPIRGLRIITGCTMPLDELVRMGRFRRDLLARLGVLRLVLAPLRERREDIVAISEDVVHHWNQQAGSPRIVLGRAAMAELVGYSWPGNARELEQTLEAVLGTARGGEISAERIRAVLGRRPRRHAAPDVFPLRQLERDYIAAVLWNCNWNQSLAARRLGIGRNTLLRKIKSFGIGRTEEVAA